MAANVGDIGRAQCALYPSGRVVVGRAPMAARAESGPIEAGTEVVVVGGDRFCLIVRPLSTSESIELLPGFGRRILSAREEASFDADLLEERRRQELASHQSLIRSLMTTGATVGFAIGIVLVAVETWRTGYSHHLLWIPPLSSVSWFCVVCLAFSLGMATENILLFVSIPCAALALVTGMWVGGPLIAVVLSFVMGSGVTIVCLVIEAMRHPIHDQ